MPFGIPRVWHEPTYHGTNGCYFCTVEIPSFSKEINHPSLPCSIAPVSHNTEELTVLLQKNENSYSSFSSDAEQDLHESGNNMKLIDSAQFSIISKDLHLSKRTTLKLRHHLRNNFLILTATQSECFYALLKVTKCVLVPTINITKETKI